MNEVTDYIASENRPAAFAVVSGIERAVELLKKQPAIGRTGRVPGTRELVIPATPYIIPYRVREGAVQVLRVLHSARRWPTEV